VRVTGRIGWLPFERDLYSSDDGCAPDEVALMSDGRTLDVCGMRCDLERGICVTDRTAPP
jgi:hypothetical protein